MSGDKSKPNGNSKQNGEQSKSRKPTKGGKDKDGDEEMTVVVPPLKKTPSVPDKEREDSDKVDAAAAEEPEVDPKEKAINGMALW